MLENILSALSTGKYLLAGALVLIPLVGLLKVTLGKYIPALASGKGAFWLTVVCGIVLSLCNSIVAGVPLTVSTVVEILLGGSALGATAAGLHRGAKVVTGTDSASK